MSRKLIDSRVSLSTLAKSAPRPYKGSRRRDWEIGMFNLSDIVQAAQGGQAIDNLAEQFGLPPGEARQAVQALLPALSAGLKNKAGDSDAMDEVLNHAADPQHQAAFQDSDAAQSDEAQMAGTRALHNIVGGEGAVAAIAQRAADVTGVSPELLQQMLPQITSIALGGVMTAMQNRGFVGGAGVPGQSPGGVGAASPQGGLGGLIGGLVGSFLGGGSQLAGGAAQLSSPGSGLSSGLAQMFEHGTSASPQLEQEFAQMIGKNN